MNSTQGTTLLNDLGDKVQLKAVGGYNDAQVFKSPKVCTPRVHCIALSFLGDAEKRRCAIDACCDH